jgi:hypothetical protein
MITSLVVTLAGVICAAICSIIGYLLISFTNTFRDSIKADTKAILDLYNKYNNLSDNFHELNGEHKGRVMVSGNCAKIA